MANTLPPPVDVTGRRPVFPTAALPENLSVWSVVLGILGLLGSTCLLGLICGPMGIVLGIIAMNRRTESRFRTACGISLSAGALVASVLAAVSVVGNLGSGDIRSWEGVVAPDFTVTTIDGSEVRLSDLKGKMVFVDVWATWCPPCIEAIPHLSELAQEYEKEGVVVLGLSTDGEDELEEFLEDEPTAYKMAAIDSDFPEPFGTVQALPTLFVIDRNGVIVAAEVGYRTYEELRMLTRLPDHAGPRVAPPVEP